MLISQNSSRFSILAILLVLTYSCNGKRLELVNATLAESFSTAVATWYGDPTGDGSGGACGWAIDVSNAPYNGMISAGNQHLFKSGEGCGDCYEVKCTEKPECSGNSIIVTITDECPDGCNNEAVHFDLSGKAFGALAKPGQADQLRKEGRMNVQYQRVPCHYAGGGSIVFKIDPGSNQYFLEFTVENVGGDGDIDHVEILPSKPAKWHPMYRSWGENWRFDITPGTEGPYTIKFTNVAQTALVVARDVIPADWAPEKSYASRVNFF